MAVSLIHEYLARRMTAPAIATDGAVTLEELRAVDLFDDLDDERARRVGWRRARCATSQPGERRSPSRARRPRACSCCSRASAQALLVDGEPHRAGRRARGADVDGRDRGAHRRLARRCACRPRPTAGWRVIAPEDFRRLAFAQPPVHRPGDAAGRARSMSRDHRAASRTASGWRRSARWRPGLAHELNNPAAAARRAAAELAEALDVLGSTLGAVRRVRDRARARPSSSSRCSARRSHARPSQRRRSTRSTRPTPRTSCSRALEELGVAEPWRLAEPLAAAGVDAGVARARRGARRPGHRRGAALGRRVADRRAASPRSSRSRPSACASLVGAVKSYAYMDRGELVEVDLHEGLETTLTVLGHKLKHTEIEVVRDYDRSLPKLTVRGSELNQVWTNLLDNAIDALGERGTITITTAPRRRVRAWSTSPTTVRASRRGPRVAIFDPFFTTKDVGQGDRPRPRHGAADRRRPPRRLADPRSQPGRTTFRVWLPSHPILIERTPWPPARISTKSASPSCPMPVDGCEECLLTGDPWLHLRICLECGHVGCCDDSPNRHASSARPREHPSDHPLAASQARNGAGAMSTKSRC